MLITDLIRRFRILRNQSLCNLERSIWRSACVSTSYRPWLPSLDSLIFQKKMFIILFGSFDKRSKYSYLPYGVTLEQYVATSYPKLYWLRKSLLSDTNFITVVDREVTLHNYSYEQVYILSDESSNVKINYLLLNELNLYLYNSVLKPFSFNSVIFAKKLSFNSTPDVGFLKRNQLFNGVTTLYSASHNNYKVDLHSIFTLIAVRNYATKHSRNFTSSKYFFIFIENLKIKSDHFFKKTESSYRKFYKSESWNPSKFHVNFLRFKENSIQFFKINFSSDHIVNKFKAFNKPTDVTVSINRFNARKEVNLSLRKNKIFNKGRYSRNRQLYRTGVYWSIWLNIILVFGLYYYFYRFTFNFGYVWLPMAVFIISIFFGRLVKYRLYEPFKLISELSYFSLLMTSYFLPTLRATPNFILDCYVHLFLFFKKKFKYSEKTVLERLQSRDKIRLELQIKSGINEANSTPAKALKKRIIYILWSHYYTYIYIATLASDESDYVFFLRRPWRADKSTPNKMYDRNFYSVHNNHYFKNNFWGDFDKKIKFRFLYKL